MKPNDKVVCVDDGPLKSASCPSRFSQPNGWVKKGQVYVVEAAIPSQDVSDTYFYDAALHIVGKPHLFDGVPVGWNAERFRLVSEIGHPPIAVKQETEVQG